MDSASISVQACGCTANSSRSAFSTHGYFSAALLTLWLRDRNMNQANSQYSHAYYTSCPFYPSPLTISHPILPTASDAHSLKTPATAAALGAPVSVCGYYVIDQCCVTVAVGFCCCYHCSVVGGVHSFVSKASFTVYKASA